MFLKNMVIVHGKCLNTYKNTQKLVLICFLVMVLWCYHGILGMYHGIPGSAMYVNTMICKFQYHSTIQSTIEFKSDTMTVPWYTAIYDFFNGNCVK